MPAATATRIREAIIKAWTGGESNARIARQQGLAYGTVRGVVKRYEATGQVEPNYEACRHTGVRKLGAIYEAAVSMKQAHPSWGAGIIWVELSEVFEEAHLPSPRTLQRWFKRAEVGTNRRRDQTHQPRVRRGQAVHEVWALDAKEAIALADGSRVSWLTISDEASGAILTAELFPPQALEPGRPSTSEALPARDDADLGSPGTDTHG